MIRLASLGLLGFLCFSILWKGGKAVDATWLLTVVASFVALSAVRARAAFSVSALLFWPAVLFVLWTGFSFVFTSTRTYGVDEVLQTTSLVLVFFSVHALLTERLKLRFAQIVSLSTLIAAALGCIVYVYQPVSRFVGSFFDYRFHTDYWPNAWAEYLLLAWPILLWTMCVRGQRRENLWSAAVVLGFVFATGLLSYSRGAFLCFIAQCAVLALLVLWKKRSRFPLLPALRVAVLSLLVALLFFTGINAVRRQAHETESVAAKVSFSASEGTSSVSERIAFWRQSFILLEEKPLFGHGPYSFRFVQPSVQEEVLATSDHAHNVILKLAMERGIVAALLFIWIFGFAAWQYLRTPHPDWLTLLAGVSVFGVILHNMIDYNLQFVGIALPLWMLLAFVVPRTEMQRRAAVLRASAVALIAALLLAVASREAYGLSLSSAARHAWAEGDAETALRQFARVEWALFSRDDWLTRSIIALEAGDLLDAEAYAQRYVVFNPDDARGFRLLGDIYLAWGQREDALRAYEKAYARSSRNDLGIARGYATLLLEQPDMLRILRPEFDRLLLQFENAILRNAHFVAISKNVEEFDQMTHVLSRAFPEDREVYTAMRNRVVEHAEEERALYRARPSGFLW